MRPPQQLDWFLLERRRFMRELENIGAAVDEQQVGRNGGFGILVLLADCSSDINI